MPTKFVANGTQQTSSSTVNYIPFCRQLGSNKPVIISNWRNNIMNIKEFENKYLKKKEMDTAIAENLKKQKELEIEAQKAKIKEVAYDIAEVIELGQFLLDHGHTLRGVEYGGSLSETEARKQLVTDAWFHYLGFFTAEDDAGIRILGVGIEAGGYLGKMSFMIDSNGEVCYGRLSRFYEEFGWWQHGVDRFFREYGEFRKKLDAYALSTLK
jgi:hypothetical protein